MLLEGKVASPSEFRVGEGPHHGHHGQAELEEAQRRFFGMLPEQQQVVS